MAPFYAEDVLGHDGNDAANRVRPEGGGANQNPDADAGNVGAREVGEFAGEDAAEDEFCEQAGDYGEARFSVALEDPEGKMAGEKDAGDEGRGEIAIFDAEEALPRSLGKRRRR